MLSLRIDLLLVLFIYLGSKLSCMPK
uniref:Uncharacterized protein n=1 Tax=Rhizophora mucronata TaxID=61149 RepID=A0A2P2NW24_RHIMU